LALHTERTHTALKRPSNSAPYALEKFCANWENPGKNTWFPICFCFFCRLGTHDGSDLRFGAIWGALASSALWAEMLQDLAALACSALWAEMFQDLLHFQQLEEEAIDDSDPDLLIFSRLSEGWVDADILSPVRGFAKQDVEDFRNLLSTKGAVTVKARNDFEYTQGGTVSKIEREYWLKISPNALPAAKKHLAGEDGYAIMHVHYAGNWDASDSRVAFDRKRSTITQVNVRHTWHEARVSVQDYLSVIESSAMNSEKTERLTAMLRLETRPFVLKFFKETARWHAEKGYFHGDPGDWNLVASALQCESLESEKTSKFWKKCEDLDKWREKKGEPILREHDGSTPASDGWLWREHDHPDQDIGTLLTSTQAYNVSCAYACVRYAKKLTPDSFLSHRRSVGAVMASVLRARKLKELITAVPSSAT
jgi:hypothetical protein